MDPQTKSGAVKMLNGTVFAMTAPAGISGYEVFACQTLTPAALAESVAATPVSEVVPLFRRVTPRAAHSLESMTPLPLPPLIEKDSTDSEAGFTVTLTGLETVTAPPLSTALATMV